MISRWCALPIVTVVLAALLAGWAQTSPPRDPAKDDYSQEAAVIEEMSTRIARSRLKMTKGNCGERTLDAPARRCRLSRPLNWRSLNEVEEVLPEYRTLGDFTTSSSPPFALFHTGR